MSKWDVNEWKYNGWCVFKVNSLQKLHKFLLCENKEAQEKEDPADLADPKQGPTKMGDVNGKPVDVLYIFNAVQTMRNVSKTRITF